MLAPVRLLTRRGSVSVTEVSREVDVAAPTAHRLLATCVPAGFAPQDRVSGPYTAPCASATRAATSRARPHARSPAGTT
ncbi:helix-turn-helix domain-containing protein [Pseudonocardia sp. DLS-67]